MVSLVVAQYAKTYFRTEQNSLKRSKHEKNKCNCIAYSTSKFKALCRRRNVPPKEKRKPTHAAHEHPWQSPERLEGSFHLQIKQAHCLINTPFRNTSIYSVDQKGQKGKFLTLSRRTSLSLNWKDII